MRGTTHKQSGYGLRHTEQLSDVLDSKNPGASNTLWKPTSERRVRTITEPDWISLLTSSRSAGSSGEQGVIWDLAFRVEFRSMDLRPQRPVSSAVNLNAAQFCSLWRHLSDPIPAHTSSQGGPGRSRWSRAMGAGYIRRVNRRHRCNSRGRGIDQIRGRTPHYCIQIIRNR